MILFLVVWHAVTSSCSFEVNGSYNSKSYKLGEAVFLFEKHSNNFILDGDCLDGGNSKYNNNITRFTSFLSKAEKYIKP